MADMNVELRVGTAVRPLTVETGVATRIEQYCPDVQVDTQCADTDMSVQKESMPLDLGVDRCCPTKVDKGVSITKERENENGMNVEIGLGTAHPTKVPRGLPTNSLSMCDKVTGDMYVSAGLGTGHPTRWP